MNENDLKNLIVTITNGAGVIQSTISLASLGKEFDLGEGEEPTDVLPTDLGDAVKEELYSNYYKDNFVRSLTSAQIVEQMDLHYGTQNPLK